MLTATPTTNPFFEDQWHLFANGQLVEQPNSPTYNQSIAVPGEDINALGAWLQGLTGAGIQVAVVDSGFDLNHEDLVFRTDLSYDYIELDSDPSNSDATDAHGTAVAGIIGARDNDVGVLGLAHSADLVALRLIPGDNDLIAPPASSGAAIFLHNGGTIAQQAVQDMDDADIVDVYNHSWGYVNQDGDRSVTVMPVLDFLALEESVLTGRASWTDVDGDGIRDPEEFTALGSIHVVSSGNDSGAGFTEPFDSVGIYRSSQYSQLTNSRYTIAVGAVDFDGSYENPATGTVTAWAETGANVLLVAPSSLIEIVEGNVDASGGGIRTTDLTGDNGFNSDPLDLGGGAVIEVDGDFMPDNNYTSIMNGTSAAAPQVTAAVALMLEANPNLSYRDVQQILMMSARQNDQFSETWVTNPMQSFDDSYVRPFYYYYDLDLDADGEADIENALMYNPDDLDVIRNYYVNEADAGLPVATVDTTGMATDEMGNELMIINMPTPDLLDPPLNPNPILIHPDDPDDTLNNGLGLSFLDSPEANTVVTDLHFTNGAGYTVSWGYGAYLEEIGYAHGVLDAGLAVELASAWATDNITLKEEITITTNVEGAGTPIRLQPAVAVQRGENIPPIVISGGISQTGNINPAYYQEFYKDISTTTIDKYVPDPMNPGMFTQMGTIGDVIVDAPFYDPQGTLNLNSGRGGNLIPFQFDEDITTDFVSLEWLEFRTNLASGDIDNLRVSLISPDGTQTELNPFRENAGEFGNTITQDPLTQQGKQRPFQEVLPGGSEDGQTGSVTLDNALAPGETWTWTTNRHWGELLSTDANSFTGISANDTWYLSLENWSANEVTIGGQFAITAHGTAATGTRIQGKVGIDDNAQGIEGYDADENFNFDRSIEFGEMVAEIDDGMGGSIFQSLTVVLDDAGDSVHHDTNNAETNRIYKTRDEITGEFEYFAVVDRDAYFDQDPTLLEGDIQNFLDQQSGAPVPLLGVGVTGVASRTDGRSVSEENFDYSQESFASAVKVVAQQYKVQYDSTGGIASRTATGVQDIFYTGADGNYYFDVESTPEAPTYIPFDPASVLAYEDWFNEFGFTYEYEISLPDAASEQIDKDFSALSDDGIANYQAGTKIYNVQVFDDVDRVNGGTSKVVDVNFLLAQDAAETNGVVEGTVFVDFNNDGVMNGADTPAPGVLVYLDLDGSGTLNGTEPNVNTDASGNYSLIVAGAASGQLVSVVVDEADMQADFPGFEFLSPNDGEQTVSLIRGGTVEADFTLNPEGITPGQGVILSGLVFNDLDSSGVQDGDEPGLPNVRVYVDLNGNGVYDDDVDGDPMTDDPENSTRSTPDGSYTIALPNGGTYTVRVDFVDSVGMFLEQTFPATPGHTVSVASGGTAMGLDFGLRDGRTQDYGDLFYVDGAVNYPTLNSDNGARHTVIAGHYLGAGVDAELDATETTDATGDDTNGFDDEDGIRLLSSQVLANSTIDIEVTALGSSSVLNAWIDFNDDGDWDDDGEQVFIDVEDLGDGVTRVLTVSTPADVAVGAVSLAARFRWGPFGIGYSGSANIGEVEDYRFDVNFPVGDYDRDGDVDNDDRGLWMASYGSTTDLRADGNGNGIVDASDYSVWRDAYEAAASFALAVSSDESQSLPALVTMPIVEQEPDPAAALMTVSAIDESLAGPAGPISGPSAEPQDVDSALLEWSLSNPSNSAEEAPEFDVLSEDGHEDESHDHGALDEFFAL